MSPPPSPPIDPRTLAAIRAVVHEALAQERELALGPIKQEIVTLQATDRRHSGTHADLTKSLRDSKPEITAAVEENVMKRVATTLDDFRREMRAVPEQAAAGALAATQSRAVTSVVAQDTTAIIAKQKADQKMAWVRMILTVTVTPVLVAIVAAIASHF